MSKRLYSETESKSVFRSRTFWVNVVTALVAVVSGALGVPVPSEYAVPIIAACNVILRLLTSDPVHVKA